MNLDALPYTVLIILAEFSVGSLIALLIADGRGMAPAGFVKLSAVLVVAGAALALLSAFNVSGGQFGGYRVDRALFDPVRGALAAYLALAVPYAWLVLGGRRRASFVAGGGALGAGLVALGLLAYQVSPPAWGFAGPLLSLLAGALVLGLVNESMVLGHWYLVSPKLPGRPLQELTFLLLVALAVQGALLIVNAAVPAREVPESGAVLAGSLGSNPAFWLRVGVGLLFPLALAYMAWRSSLEQAMMSATGLLYIAVGAVFAGEVLARGLLFVTGAPV
ncbi:MAG: hypothetical protein HY723_00785 [Chloroflexi bacterium]|nr:hypothetical protein [Chloroflexota bacterium]